MQRQILEEVLGKARHFLDPNKISSGGIWTPTSLKQISAAVTVPLSVEEKLLVFFPIVENILEGPFGTVETPVSSHTG